MTTQERKAFEAMREALRNLLQWEHPLTGLKEAPAWERARAALALADKVKP